MEDLASRFGPAWKGWEAYQLFAGSVKTNLRYFRRGINRDFLNKVRATYRNRMITIPQGDIYWRARKGCEYERVSREDGNITVCWGEERPYGQEGMKPVSNWQNEGRANPRGIPHLYLATTRDTALAEIRPWIGSTISVAQFQIRRDLNVIDCSKYHEKRTLLVWVSWKMACGLPSIRRSLLR